MGDRAESLSLHDDEERGANYRNKVKRQVHEVSNYRLWRKALEWFAHQLAHTSNRVAAGRNLSLAGDESSLVASNKRLCQRLASDPPEATSKLAYAIESVDKSIIDKEILAQDVENGGAFAEHEQYCCHNSQGTIHEREKRSLWQVGE
jgi:hypothetical protein